MNDIAIQAKKAAEEIIEAAFLKKGDILVIGCSTSEVLGDKLGTNSSPDTAKILFESIYEVVSEKGIYLAAQCCEHLNRAIIIEREAVPFAEQVNVVPQPKAGGSFATQAYEHFKNPIAIEEIKADAGIDIGQTLIGMHLKKVAVPVRLSIKSIGEAPVTAARTRPKFIGGERAFYDKTLMGSAR
ncbi:MAG: TIGR01440 family protein [Clostridia bacterium]|nr:TIGR01440 family protein [Clostridia bacterium]